jgi:hypothetical protein
MKHLKGTSEFHALKAELKAQQPKYKYMITVEQCLLFAEWIGYRYERSGGGVWYAFRGDTNKPYTTKELWELYQAFLGKKK